MNKGIICKAKIDDEFRYCIRLENTIKVKDKNGKETEYNIFIIKTNDPTPEAKLFPVEEYLTCEFDLSAYLGKKLVFSIDWTNKQLTSIEYEA